MKNSTKFCFISKAKCHENALCFFVNIRNNWINLRPVHLMRSNILKTENWMKSTVSFLCCFDPILVLLSLFCPWLGRRCPTERQPEFKHWASLSPFLVLCPPGSALQRLHAESDPYKTYDWDLHLPNVLESSYELYDNSANWVNLVKHDECHVKAMRGRLWILESVLVTAAVLILTNSIEEKITE